MSLLALFAMGGVLTKAQEVLKRIAFNYILLILIAKGKYISSKNVLKMKIKQ